MKCFEGFTMDTAAVRDSRVRRIAIVTGRLDPAETLAAVGDASAGGNVLFVGTAWAATDGVVTTRLEYEAHEPLARAVLERIRQAAMVEFRLVGCGIAHRLGLVEPGEANVIVATSSPHRREAFAATEWIMDRIKREVPIWKREHRLDGGRCWEHGSGVPDAVGGPP